MAMAMSLRTGKTRDRFFDACNAYPTLRSGGTVLRLSQHAGHSHHGVDNVAISGA